MPQRSRLLLVPVLLTSALLAGCGGGGDEAEQTSGERAGEVSFATWADDVNKYCRAAEQAFEDLPEPADEQDYATLEELAVGSKRLAADFIDDVEDLGTPDRNAATAAEFVGTYRSFEQSMDELADAAAAEDPEAVQEAADAVESQGAEQDRLAQELGLDDCWEPDDADDADDAADALPLAEWQAEVDAACAALNPQYNATNDIEFDPNDIAAAQPYATGLNAFMTSTIAEFDRIGAPAEQADTAQELYDVLTRMQAATQDMVDAVAAGDLDAASAAEDEFLATAQEANPLAEELEIPSCGGF